MNDTYAAIEMIVSACLRSGASHALILRAMKAQLVLVSRSAIAAGCPEIVFTHLRVARRALDKAALDIEDADLMRTTGIEDLP